MKNAYLGGNPIDKKGEKDADLNKVDRYKREYSSFAIGVRFNLPSFASGYITPYAELTGGLQIYNIYLLMNQLDDESMPAISPPSYLLEIDHYFPLLCFEGGLTILPEDLVVFQDTSMQVELFGGVNYLFAGDTDAITTYRYIHRMWADPTFPMEDRGFAGRFIPYFGFGVKFGFDL